MASFLWHFRNINKSLGAEISCTFTHLCKTIWQHMEGKESREGQQKKEELTPLVFQRSKIVAPKTEKEWTKNRGDNQQHHPRHHQQPAPPPQCPSLSVSPYFSLCHCFAPPYPLAKCLFVNNSTASLCHRYTAYIPTITAFLLLFPPHFTVTLSLKNHVFIYPRKAIYHRGSPSNHHNIDLTKSEGNQILPEKKHQSNTDGKKISKEWRKYGNLRHADSEMKSDTERKKEEVWVMGNNGRRTVAFQQNWKTMVEEEDL